MPEGTASQGPAIEDWLLENRRFPPGDRTKADALVTDTSMYREAETDVDGFWARQALALDWDREWDSICEWEPPFASWFVGGKLNASANCLDRHVAAGLGERVAYYWEG